MSRPRTILITGATGKQGRAVLNALSTLPTQPFHILALVRDPTTPSSISLSKLSNVTLLPGNLNNPTAIFTATTHTIWGVYSVQINSPTELTQGTTLIDAAAAHGVKHLVYSSGDRGGPERSDRDPTTVKNFATKFAIERHLMAACQASEKQGDPMTYTILRPVTFFENQATDIHGTGFGRMWMQIGNGEKPLQMVSVRDVGWFAAQAFADSQGVKYRNTALSLAGDELSAKEAEKIFVEVTGKKMPLAPCIVGKGLKFVHRDTLGDMFAWFEGEGYGADVEGCRRENVEMLDYKTWLREFSGFV